MKRCLLIFLLALLLGAMSNVAVAWWFAAVDDDEWDGGGMIGRQPGLGQIQYLDNDLFPGVAEDQDVLVTAFVQRRRGAMRVTINTWQADSPRGRFVPLTEGLQAPTWVDPNSPAYSANVQWNQIKYVDGYGFPYPALACVWIDDPRFERAADAITLTPRVEPIAPATPTARGQGLILTGDSFDMIGPPPPPTPLAAPAASAQKQVPHVLPLQPIWPGFAINTIVYAMVLWLPIGLPFALVALRRRRRRRHRLCAACAYPIGVSEVCTECGKRVSTG